MIRNIMVMNMNFIFVYPDIVYEIFNKMNIEENQNVLQKICMFLSFN